MRARFNPHMRIFRKYAIWGLVIAAALTYFFAAGLSDGRLHVYALNVGQGDALLIRTPADQFILVDGGPDDSVLNEMSEVMPFYRHDLELVILTHPHPDHVNGLVEVLRRYEVELVVMTGISYDYAGYTAFLETIASRHVPVKFANGTEMALDHLGRFSENNADRTHSPAAEKEALFHGSAEKASLDQVNEVKLDFLYPSSSIQGRKFMNINNSSIVFKLVYGKTAFLFTGDCEVECEHAILENTAATGADLSADVLKVGHHGSRTASSDAFLDAVFDASGEAGSAALSTGTSEGASPTGTSESANPIGAGESARPKYAIISCGVGNRFKHPHPETISKLLARGVRISRTDLDGRIEFISDGQRITKR
jgi:competence protein ComEC